MSDASLDEQVAGLPNGISLCYRSMGDPEAPVVLLIAGLGLQLVYWPRVLIDALVAAGYRVIAFDNRDAGRSSRCDSPHPGRFGQLLRRVPGGAYSLEDMAQDVAHLMTHLGVARAHVFGMSMGGMIAQALAAGHPRRVATLTSLFSTTGNRWVGQPALSTMWRMATARRPRSQDEAVAVYVQAMRHIGDAGVPGIQDEWARYAALAWRRNGRRADARAFSRQIGAILKSGDRSASLRKIQAPTLVLHGDVDRIVHPSGGLATAAAIAGARFESLVGMRHQIDEHQVGRMMPLLVEHFGRAR